MARVNGESEEGKPATSPGHQLCENHVAPTCGLLGPGMPCGVTWHGMPASCKHSQNLPSILVLCPFDYLPPFLSCYSALPVIAFPSLPGLTKMCFLLCAPILRLWGEERTWCECKNSTLLSLRQALWVKEEAGFLLCIALLGWGPFTHHADVGEPVLQYSVCNRS